MPTVTKKDLANTIAEHTGLTQTECKNTIAELLSLIEDVLGENNSIELRGFGTFYPKVRMPRPARNIHTGEVVPLLKRVVPLFRYSSPCVNAVQDALSGGEITSLFDID